MAVRPTFVVCNQLFVYLVVLMKLHRLLKTQCITIIRTNMLMILRKTDAVCSETRMELNAVWTKAEFLLMLKQIIYIVTIVLQSNNSLIFFSSNVSSILSWRQCLCSRSMYRVHDVTGVLKQIHQQISNICNISRSFVLPYIKLLTFCSGIPLISLLLIFNE